MQKTGVQTDKSAKINELEQNNYNNPLFDEFAYTRKGSFYSIQVDLIHLNLL